MDNETAAPLGRNLKYFRMKRGMSQFALARESGVTQGHISLLEQGKYRDIYMSRGIALARALGITCEDLMSENIHG